MILLEEEMLVEIVVKILVNFAEKVLSIAINIISYRKGGKEIKIKRYSNKYRIENRRKRIVNGIKEIVAL